MPEYDRRNAAIHTRGMAFWMPHVMRMDVRGCPNPLHVEKIRPAGRVHARPAGRCPHHVGAKIRTGLSVRAALDVVGDAVLRVLRPRTLLRADERGGVHRGAVRLHHRGAGEDLRGEGAGERIARAHRVGHLDVRVEIVELSPVFAMIVLNVEPPVRIT